MADVPEDWQCMTEDEPRCPYCGEHQGDFWEVRSDEGEANCCSCGRPFLYVREITVSYSTEPVVGPHQLSDFWQKEDAKAFPLARTEDE